MKGGDFMVTIARERKDLEDFQALTASAIGVADLLALAEETQQSSFLVEPVLASCSFTCNEMSCGVTCVKEEEA
jgi:hypothetical protein